MDHPEENETALTTLSRSIEAEVSLTNIPLGEEDDDAVISMLEVKSTNENAFSRQDSTSDEQSEQPLYMLPSSEQCSSEKSAIATDHHTLTVATPQTESTPDPMPAQMLGEAPAERSHAEHVRDTGEKDAPAMRANKSTILVPFKEEDHTGTSVELARVPNNASDLPMIVVTPPASTLMPPLEQEISTSNADALEYENPHVEIVASSASPAMDNSAPESATRNISLPTDDGYMHSDSRPTTQGALNDQSVIDPSPRTSLSGSPSQSEGISTAAPFPSTFKHYHVFALPTGQPASPHHGSHTSNPTTLCAANQDTYGSLTTPAAAFLSTPASRIPDISAKELLTRHTDDSDRPSTDFALPEPNESDDLEDSPNFGQPPLATVLLDGENEHVPSVLASLTTDDSAESAYTQSALPNMLPTVGLLGSDTLSSVESIEAHAVVTTEGAQPEVSSATSTILAAPAPSSTPEAAGPTPAADSTTTAQLPIPDAHCAEKASESIELSSEAHLCTAVQDLPSVEPSTAAYPDSACSPLLEPVSDHDLLSQSVPISTAEQIEGEPTIISTEAYPGSGQTTQPLDASCMHPNPSSIVFQVDLPGDTSAVDSSAPSLEENSMNLHEYACNEASENPFSTTTAGLPDPSNFELPPSSPPLSQGSTHDLVPSVDMTDNNEHGDARDEDAQESIYMDDTLPPSSPLLSSSQPRASSPDRIFDSSSFDFDSPPSSPQLLPVGDEKNIGKELEAMSSAPASESVVLGKRRAEGDEDTRTKIPKLEGTITLPPPPNPKRPTQASQKKQYRKLVKPFRSPLVNIEDVLAGKDAVYASGHVRSQTPDILATKNRTLTEAAVKSMHEEEQVDDTRLSGPVANRDRTANAAKPFRAPFCMPSTAIATGTSGSKSLALSSSSRATSGVHAASTIQTLQARVQKLKQAIKIKEDRVQGADDDKLETLVAKWRSVGREVAWLVWDTVKDLEPGAAVGVLPARGGWDEGENPFAGGGSGRGGGRGKGDGGFDGGWGYDDGKGGRGRGMSSGWGWDEKSGGDGEREGGGGNTEGEEHEESMDADEDAQVSNHTLGTMLRHVGIDPDTLGWDEDEGDFVGDA